VSHAEPIWAALCLIFLMELLHSEWKDNQRGRYFAKPLASLCFILFGLTAGGEGTWAALVIAGLVLGAIGDVLLIPKDRRAFLGGLVSFLLSHVAYLAAFLALGPDWTRAGIATPILIGIAAVVGRWLLPNVDAKMKGPVLAYIVAITAMVIASIGVSAVHWLLPLAAAMFFVSDLAVARNRFVTPTPWNRMWGLPLYYGAQLLFGLALANA
jgi:uncharacterized membrane protein YhhN